MVADGAVHHRLTVRQTLGALRLDAALELAAPWTLIFGPSGSGKSSLLRGACGLLGEGARFERSDAAGRWKDLSAMHPPQRELTYAPQSATLFPHLTVLENVAFGVESRGVSRDGVDEALEMFELGGMVARMPRELSGGEQQRVNLARAFAVPGAKLMLLDEPFTGVDRAMRDALLVRMLERVKERGVPVVSVSHDVDEALLLEAEVVVLEQGRVVAQGPAAEVLREERERMLVALQVREVERRVEKDP